MTISEENFIFGQNKSTHVFHLYVVRVEKREELQVFLKSKGIQTGIHYPIALPDLKAYKILNYSSNTLNAQKNSNNLLSLPIGDHMEIEDADHGFMCEQRASFNPNASALGWKLLMSELSF